MAEKDRDEITEFEIDFEEEFDSPYASWIREGLDKNKWKPADLAEKSGVSLPAIYNILSNKSKKPQKRTIDKLKSSLKLGAPKVEGQGDLSEVGLGELTDFDPHDELDHPECNGVYVFYDVTDRPVYVGRTTSENRSIKARVKDHYEKFWFKRPIVNNAAFIQIDDADLCKKIERALIRFLKSNAVLNRQHVDRKRK